MSQNQVPVTKTEHKIGKVTYLVCSSASERATDTLDKKIKKLIRKDIEQKPVKARKSGVVHILGVEFGGGRRYNISSINTSLSVVGKEDKCYRQTRLPLYIAD